MAQDKIKLTESDVALLIAEKLMLETLVESQESELEELKKTCSQLREENLFLKESSDMTWEAYQELYQSHKSFIDEVNGEMKNINTKIDIASETNQELRKTIIKYNQRALEIKEKAIEARHGQSRLIEKNILNDWLEHLDDCSKFGKRPMSKNKFAEIAAKKYNRAPKTIRDKMNNFPNPSGYPHS